MRLEALAPFGAPALLLASDGATTTLLFPRDGQVLREASVADVLDAITGLALDADELRDVLFGCLDLDVGVGLRFNERVAGRRRRAASASTCSAAGSPPPTIAAGRSTTARRPAAPAALSASAGP